MPTGHDHEDGHHHHHHHRHHRPVRVGTARPDRPHLSLLSLSLQTRLTVAAALSLIVWAGLWGVIR